jgi:hypothetical protein
MRWRQVSPKRLVAGMWSSGERLVATPPRSRAGPNWQRRTQHRSGRVGAHLGGDLGLATSSHPLASASFGASSPAAGRTLLNDEIARRDRPHRGQRDRATTRLATPRIVPRIASEIVDACCSFDRRPSLRITGHCPGGRSVPTQRLQAIGRVPAVTDATTVPSII